MSPPSPGIIEHRRSWLAYFRGVDSKTNDHDDPHASAWRGFKKWARGFFYRGYATEDDGTPYDHDVYACPWYPEKLAAHEAAHTPTFGRAFQPIQSTQDANGSLNHEPLATLDIMLPGYLSPLRFNDSRGIQAAYRFWVADGRIRQVREG